MDNNDLGIVYSEQVQTNDHYYWWNHHPNSASEARITLVEATIIVIGVIIATLLMIAVWA